MVCAYKYTYYNYSAHQNILPYLWSCYISSHYVYDAVYLTVWAKTHLVCNCREIQFWKFNLKKPALPWYWTCSLSITILSYLLAFVQLTWQVDDGWFSLFSDYFFRGIHYFGPASIKGGWVGEMQGWSGWWQRLKQRSKMTQIVEFRMAMTSTCTHKGPMFHYKA